MPKEKNENSGVLPYWQITNIFPVFSYEGFPKGFLPHKEKACYVLLCSDG